MKNPKPAKPATRAKEPKLPAKRAAKSDSLIVRLNNANGPELHRKVDRMASDVQTLNAVVQMFHGALLARSVDDDWAFAATLFSATFRPLCDTEETVKELRTLLFGDDADTQEVANA